VILSYSVKPNRMHTDRSSGEFEAMPGPIPLLQQNHFLRGLIAIATQTIEVNAAAHPAAAALVTAVPSHEMVASSLLFIDQHLHELSQGIEDLQ